MSACSPDVRLGGVSELRTCPRGPLEHKVRSDAVARAAFRQGRHHPARPAHRPRDRPGHRRAHRRAAVSRWGRVAAGPARHRPHGSAGDPPRRIAKQVSLHTLRHAFITAAQGRGVASDATFRYRSEDDGTGRSSRRALAVADGQHARNLRSRWVCEDPAASDAATLHPVPLRSMPVRCIQLNVKARATRADAPSRRPAR
jgi:hypothetical protein